MEIIARNKSWSDFEASVQKLLYRYSKSYIKRTTQRRFNYTRQPTRVHSCFKISYRGEWSFGAQKILNSIQRHPFVIGLDTRIPVIAKARLLRLNRSTPDTANTVDSHSTPAQTTQAKPQTIVKEAPVQKTSPIIDKTPKTVEAANAIAQTQTSPKRMIVNQRCRQHLKHRH